MAALLFLASVARADDDPSDIGKRLKDIETKLERDKARSRDLDRRATALDREITVLRRELVTAAAAMQESESRATQLEGELARLEQDEADRRAQLRSRVAQQTWVLGAVQRLARHPPEALIAHPLDANQLVRSAILLRTAVPEIQDRAGRLRTELAALAATRNAIVVQRRQLAAVNVDLGKERKRLDDLLARKRTLHKQTAEESRRTQRRMARLARDADNLRGLLDSLRIQAEEARKQRELEEQRRRAAAVRAQTETASRPVSAPPVTVFAPGRPITEAKGSLWFPASGRITQRYGQAAATGLTRKGIIIETRGGAQVVAPYEGKVVFAGHFRSYGQLLIIEHGHGYHSLIAGLGRIDSVVGQWLLAGEPVGTMEERGNSRPALYVEMRRDGHPVNPLPWLSPRSKKVQG